MAAAASVLATNVVSFCQVCHGGFQRVRRCAKCFEGAYCGVECQRKDWRNHRVTCVAAGANVAAVLRECKPIAEVIHGFDPPLPAVMMAFDGASS